MGQKREIFQLLAVIFSAVGAAVIVAGVMLYSYGPTGRYVAQNVLLEPDVLPQLSYQEGGNRFDFANLQVAYHDPESGNWIKGEISLDLYRDIFALLKNDRSLSDVPDALKTRFNQEKLLRLSVLVKPKGQGMDTPFQEIDFAKNAYRVELMENQGGFAYFHHPDIQEKITGLITDENTR